VKPHRLTNRELWQNHIRLLVGYKSGQDVSPLGVGVIMIVAIVVSAVAFFLLK